MKLIRIDDHLSVNPDHVVSVQRNGTQGTKIFVLGSDAPHSTREPFPVVIERLLEHTSWGRR